jgi:hypothetical protein
MQEKSQGSATYMKVTMKEFTDLSLSGADSIQIEWSSFCIELLIFNFNFKGKLIFKSQKSCFSGLSQNMWLIHINSAHIANIR